MREQYDKLSDKERLQLEDIEGQLARGGAKPCEDAGRKKNEPEVIPRGKKETGRLIMGKFSKRINDLINAGKYAEAREWIRSGLKWTPDDHWLLDRMSLTYNEQGQYARALNWIEKAYKYARDCPMVLWGYADTLALSGKEQEATRVFRRLYRLANKALNGDRGRCEWEDDERSFVTDVSYRLANIYETLKNTDQARHWMLKYRFWTDQGWPTNYPLSEHTILPNYGSSASGVLPSRSALWLRPSSFEDGVSGEKHAKPQVSISQIGREKSLPAIPIQLFGSAEATLSIRI